MDNKKTHSKTQNAQAKKISLIALGVLGLYFVSLFVPYIYPYTQYPLYFIKCGGAPLPATDFAASYSYDRPGDKYYRVDIFTTRYFCTEQEAQAAGYRHNGLSDVPTR